MDDAILNYYEQELTFIRQMGVEFAKKYPKIARRLLLEPDKCEDPHTERLIEAFAFISGRIRKKIDDDFPEITDALETAERGLCEQLRAELTDHKRVPVLALDPEDLSQKTWTPAQRYLLTRVDGQRQLRSIIMVSPLKEVEALLTFRTLFRAGVVSWK